MTENDARTGTAPDEGTGSALKRPEAPDRDAVEQHASEGDGPFGADMQHVLGGTRTGQDAEHAGTPYSTGTDAATGGSVSAHDTRSTFRAQGGAEISGTDAGAEPGET
ncbi:hypothetical protein [Deinococcus hohokamensis]|uniref:Uncharacterized protein n=1 Tax=Deinococcus hohokamensis TaxID=309883 RepID=A0ABV9IAA8_9DEIO